MKKHTKILLAILSGVLLSPAYYQWGTGFMIFIGLIPILFVEDAMYEKREANKTRHILPYAILAFMIFTVLTVWWVKNSVWVALLASMIVVPSFMVLPFLLFHYVKRISGPRLGYVTLVVTWIAFEYLHQHVKINFPWIHLGNAFADDVLFIQWYEITGTQGGSLWVLLINILLFKLLKGLFADFSLRKHRGLISWILGILLFPILVSIVRFYSYEEERRPYECVVLQPNIDPWAKFHDPQDIQTIELLQLADSIVSGTTDYIIGPETFLNQNVWQYAMDQNRDINRFYEFVEDYPRANFIIGAMTYKRYLPGDTLSATAKKLGNKGLYYDSFNSALQLDSSRVIQMYHKSLLVAGVEWMPAFNRFKFIQKLAVDLGGITRSHGTQEERSVFISPQDGVKVAPVICWESVFGEFVTEYVREKGAEFIFIITNDGWWKDTPGHRQHNSYARLRAIETRRSIARSANTGISSLINQKGEILESIGWWQRSAIKRTLNANDHLTFYVKHGDYIARISSFLSVLLVLYAFIRKRVFKRT
ncbi:apolipoprotein N-acyltransferase [Bacteroidota bacterium]